MSLLVAASTLRGMKMGLTDMMKGGMLRARTSTVREGEGGMEVEVSSCGTWQASPVTTCNL